MRQTPAGMAIRVLLYSPLVGLDPPSGDTTYTDTLIKNPPAGVEYTTYSEALKDGRMMERGRRPRVRRMTPTDLGILGMRMGELAARKHFMFPEATRFITVDTNSFDLIHNHIFSLRQVGPRLPIVSSAGYPLSELYRSRNNWRKTRARIADRLEIALARSLRSHRAGYWAPDPDLLTVYTQHYRQWLIDCGTPAERVELLGQGLEDASVPGPVDGLVLGFIGRDFVRKGGLRAVEAFDVVRKGLPDARLLIVSDRASVPTEIRSRANVELVTNAARDEVLGDHLPRMSVLLAPTRSDCGVPYAVVESLRAGVPVVLSSNEWLEERLEPPGVRRASEPAEVARIADELLRDPTRLRVARDGARAEFERLLSLPTWHANLCNAYELALARWRGTSHRRP